MIPSVVHRIAIGPVPDKYEEYWQRWQELHPEWTFKTWTEPFNPDEWETGQFFAEASCASQMSDFLRYEIVWREGGIYTDWDVEPYKRFDRFLEHPFFIGTEDNAHLSPGLFGAEPGHPATRACIDSHLARQWTTNPSTTGPLTATRVLRGRADVTVVPRELFYPYHYTQMYLAGARFPDAYSAHHWGYSWSEVVR
jgi:mannosyltransferase OCH1-like enzyme